MGRVNVGSVKVNKGDADKTHLCFNENPRINKCFMYCTYRPGNQTFNLTLSFDLLQNMHELEITSSGNATNLDVGWIKSEI